MAHESLSSNSSPNSTPKKSRNGFKFHNKDKKNPYSDRGLDKFSALLTDLEEKRQKIYSQIDPQNIVMVRFAYKNSDECVPVVVKQKNKKEEEDKHVTDSESMEVKLEQSKLPTTQKFADKKKNIVRVRNLRRLSKPSYYITAMVILILFLLSVFGKSATILCTCVVWYLVPLLKQSSSNSRDSTRPRNENQRFLSPNKMDHPHGSSAVSSPIHRHHRKSW